MEEDKTKTTSEEDDSATTDESEPEATTTLEGRKILHESLLLLRTASNSHPRRGPETDDDDFNHEESFGLIEASIAQIEANMFACAQSPDPKFFRRRFNTPSSTPPITPPTTPSRPSPLTPKPSPILDSPLPPVILPPPFPKPTQKPLPIRFFVASDMLVLSICVGVASLLSIQSGIALMTFLCVLTLLLQLNQDVYGREPTVLSLRFLAIVRKLSFPVFWLFLKWAPAKVLAEEKVVEEDFSSLIVPEAPPLTLDVDSPVKPTPAIALEITPPAEEPTLLNDPNIPEAPEGPPGPPGAPPGFPGFEEPVETYGLPTIPVITSQLKLKALHWSVLTPVKVKGTIWEELALRRETEEKLNYEHFEKCFQEKKVVVKCLMKEPDKRIRFLDHKRSNLVEIALSSFPVNTPTLLEAILSMNEEIIFPDRLTRLVEMLPNEKEKTALKAHANTPRDQLGDAEAFLVQLATIPHLDIRLSTHLCITQFRERCVYLEASLESVALALDELRGSENLRKVLSCVLNFGNHMNTSNGKTPAYGFGLDTLDKLVITKTVDRSMNLLHFIIDFLRGASGQKVVAESATGPKQPSFLSDLTHLPAAARVECASVVGELRTMKKEFDMIRRALMLIDPSSDEKDGDKADTLRLDKFGVKVRRFYCDGLVSYRRLASRLRTNCAAAQDLAMYLGSYSVDQMVQRREGAEEHQLKTPRRLKDRDDLDLDLYGWNDIFSVFKSFRDTFSKAESELDEIHRARIRKEKQPPKLKKTLQPPSAAAASLASVLRASPMAAARQRSS